MTTTLTPKTSTGQRVELGRYTTPASGERIVYGQRVDGAVRLTDKPEGPRGRSYLIESGLHSYRELEAIVRDYLELAARHQMVPMRICGLDAAE
jgi:hypothetical protein